LLNVFLITFVGVSPQQSLQLAAPCEVRVGSFGKYIIPDAIEIGFHDAFIT
jgi:hypothetical protein